MTILRRIIVCCAISMAALGAHAKDFPDKPIKFIVPFSAGGSTDITARAVAEAMSKYLGERVVVENRPGAAGSLGAAMVARSAADGYTMLAGGVGPISVVPEVDGNLPYNPSKDLEAVGQITNNDYALVVNSASSFKTVRDLFDAAKARPGQVSYMTTGIGGPLHVSMEYFAKKQDLKLNHIPYQGENQAVTDLLTGRLDVALMSVTAIAPLVKSGKVRPIALMGFKRSPVLPNVPTIRESGYKDFEIPVWLGLFVPKGTPQVAVDKLHSALQKALQQQDVKGRLLELGADPVGGSREEYLTFLSSESVRWKTRVAETGIRR
ncbi:tripartite tricarboxylate transporter substrate binding protein [Cupriavidus sp. D384]|uniref:Bug family tripartite tricarboxylate transporter substrate binding protein n=1 Tax=Cupriavidus sp. D384 TaxID=1538095 RepID=UPI00082F549A|nr:tripartite tricarboxylate transporter substrate binding protein [Cupriavidus sp. D384]